MVVKQYWDKRKLKKNIAFIRCDGIEEEYDMKQVLGWNQTVNIAVMLVCALTIRTPHRHVLCKETYLGVSEILVEPWV